MNDIEKQYQNAKNLNTRISIHDKYSINCQPFGDWIMSHYAPFRGKGYAVPALKLLLDHAFRDCGISRLHNDFETTRDAAWAIHRKVGFRELGVEDGLLRLMLTKEEYLNNDFWI